MEETVNETLFLLKPLLINDPFLANMDHAKLLLRPPIRYIYDLILAISLSFPALQKSLTLTDRNRNLALKNDATQRDFFQKIAGFVQAKDKGDTPSVLSMFDVDVFLKGKGTKQTNFLLQKLAKTATESNKKVKHPNGSSTGRSISGSSTNLAEAKKPSNKFVGNILRPKSIALGSSTSKVMDRRKRFTAPADGGSAMPKATSACSFQQQAWKAPAIPSLLPLSSDMFPRKKSQSPLSITNGFSALEDGLLDEEYSPQEFSALTEFPECEPVSTANFENLLKEMRELADSIKGLKLRNSSILKELTSADQTMRATSRSLKVLDTYSFVEDDIKYAETTK